MNKITSVALNIKNYWRTPPEGRYMPYREILSLSTGGIGQKFIVYCVSQMIISIGNVLIGNTIGIEPSAMYVIYILSILSGFPLTGLRANMIDNTRSMRGKYRPYLITMGIPTVILGVGFIIMPYENMSQTAKCVTVLAFNIGFQFFYNFYTDAYDSLVNVLSPNSIERSDLLSVRSVIENLSPSLAGIFLPIAAKLITGQNTLYDLRVYRALFPPMLLAGFVISMLAYVNTEEKIVQAKSHVIRVRFSDAFRSVARNKYFWIISLAGWLGFLEGSFGSIMGWMFNYQEACSAAQYSLITAIAGNASFWPNLVGPVVIRKYGKKKVLVVTNLLNIGFIALMLPIVKTTGKNYTIWLLLACNFINQFITSLGHLLGPSIQADIRDYQQYIAGERIDGMFAAVGLIGNVITLLTSSVLPALYKRAGLNKTVAAALGRTNVYDVLYDKGYFVRISSILVSASVVGAAMNVIPFFFYDLTENDQRGIVSVLKIRALFEDYSNGALKDEDMREALKIIENAEKFNGKPLNVIDRTGLKKAKKSGDSRAVAEEKEKIRKLKEENVYIATAPRILDELNRFNTESGIALLQTARETAAPGLQGFINAKLPSVREARALPKQTAAQREQRKTAIRFAAEVKRAKKAAAKYFPDGIIREFDASVFGTLFDAENENEQAVADTLKKMKNARTARNKDEEKRLKAELVSLKAERREINAGIKDATARNSEYYRAAKPYLDAVKLIKQSEDYSKYSEIKERSKI